MGRRHCFVGDPSIVETSLRPAACPASRGTPRADARKEGSADTPSGFARSSAINSSERCSDYCWTGLPPLRFTTLTALGYTCAVNFPSDVSFPPTSPTASTITGPGTTLSEA